jgi:hypothetical protein
MKNLYMTIDMDNGSVSTDRMTLEEGLIELGNGNYALMPMADKDDSPQFRCSFCGRHGFEETPEHED